MATTKDCTPDDEIVETETTTTDTNADTYTLPAQKLINPFQLFRQQNPGGGFFKGDLLKMDHKTGKVLREHGKDSTVVDTEAERFIVNPIEMIDTWTKFIAGKFIERHVYRTAVGEMAPRRDALDFTDEQSWPRDDYGKRKDPWQRGVYLPMKCSSDGDIVAFKATGKSAIGEIGEFVGMYGSADRKGKLPVVKIESRSFETDYGPTFVPVFKLTDWVFWENDEPTPMPEPVVVPTAPPPAPPMKALPPKGNSGGGDMDDEIPF